MTRDQRIRSLVMDLAELADEVVSADGFWGNEEIRRHMVDRADALVVEAREVLDRHLPAPKPEPAVMHGTGATCPW